MRNDTPESVLDGEEVREPECSTVNANPGSRGLQDSEWLTNGSVEGRLQWSSMAVVFELEETYVGPEIVAVVNCTRLRGTCNMICAASQRLLWDECLLVYARGAFVTGALGKA